MQVFSPLLCRLILRLTRSQPLCTSCASSHIPPPARSHQSFAPHLIPTSLLSLLFYSASSLLFFPPLCASLCITTVAAAPLSSGLVLDDAALEQGDPPSSQNIAKRPRTSIRLPTKRVDYTDTRAETKHTARHLLDITTEPLPNLVLPLFRSYHFPSCCIPSPAFYIIAESFHCFNSSSWLRLFSNPSTAAPHGPFLLSTCSATTSNKHENCTGTRFGAMVRFAVAHSKP